MALTNAEKQRRWRQHHAEHRRAVARIATMLMRRSHKTGRIIQAKLGWNGVTFDAYFFDLAHLLADVLKTDRALKQLKWALAARVDDRKRARQFENERKAREARERSRERAIEYALDG
jgi:hypothetical protein